MYDTFDNSYQATIGIDFLSKIVYLENRTVSYFELLNLKGLIRIPVHSVTLNTFSLGYFLFTSFTISNNDDHIYNKF